jgi:hypothetical protein
MAGLGFHFCTPSQESSDRVADLVGTDIHFTNLGAAQFEENFDPIEKLSILAVAPAIFIDAIASNTNHWVRGHISMRPTRAPTLSSALI